MSIHELESKARDLQELKRLREDLDAEIAAAEDAIKAHMGDTEEITAGAFKIRWKPVTSARFDSKAFKAEQPALYERYAIRTTVRRFTVA